MIYWFVVEPPIPTQCWKINIWLVVYLPLWKIWLRQLGVSFPISGKSKKCSKPPTRHACQPPRRIVAVQLLYSTPRSWACIGSVAVIGIIDVLSTVKMKTGRLSNEFLVIKRASYCKTGEQKKIGHIYIYICIHILWVLYSIHLDFLKEI